MSGSDLDGQGAAAQGDFYDVLPYESHPFHESQPAHVAAVATLFGLTPPPVATARVLEIGCASGGNLIPLAARFPEARFLGLDRAPRHVALAARRIADLGLGNIDIRVADVSQPGTVEARFDYIICHGVFSWVDAATQDAILRICADHLAPEGVAYVSYNVLPGWQMRRVVGDILRFDDDPGADIVARIARGRRLLGQLATAAGETTPYGQLLKREAAQLEARADSYIAGEFFVDENNPCFFRDFAARAAAHGLDHLADANIAAATVAETNPQMARVLAAMAGDDRARFEQCQDLLVGTQFRRSLLVRSSPARAAPRPAPGHLATLHFASRLRLQGAPSAGAELKLADPDGKGMATNDPMVAAALDHLGRSFPDTRGLGDLVSALGIADAPTRTAVAGRLLDAMLRISAAGLGWITAEPTRTGRADADRPMLWRVARAELAAGQSWLTNQRHVAVRLDRLGQLLAPCLDGRHGRDDLAAVLARALRDGALDPAHLPASGAAGPDDPEAQAALIERWLAKVGEMALLAPASPAP